MTSTHVIVGLRPSWGVHRTIVGSSTTRRLDQLLPDWRAWFDTRNVFANSELSVADEDPCEIVDWLDTRKVDVVVTLGQRVCDIVAPSMSSCEWLSIGSVYLNSASKRTFVVKLPHPSGRNRWYNDPKNVSNASRTLWVASRLGRDYRD